ncbi:SPOR domain-containing protein [Mesorhizobium sp. 1M-11]|uniref:SPOR domain-containing protein n=1 Tax=Mesorhizobium sp. 1M-11 TaxID=1529006 RepID=UPI0006C761D1|nr:SPOR domain-containing protein [Mesorhizobium sp. 1M-11]
MADRTQARVANHNDIASDDPFAELTRIMGFDPREPVQRQAAPQPTAGQAEDFDIDLEKELMGEFEAYDEEPVAAAQPLAALPPQATEPHADETVDDDFVASMEQEFRAAEPAVSAVAAPVEDDAPDFDFAAAAESLDEQAFDEAVAIDDEVQPQATPTGQQFEDYEAAMSDVDFGDLDFADETAGDPVATVEPVVAEQVSAEPVAEESASFAVEPSAVVAGDDFDAHFDTAMADVDMDFSAHDEAPVVAAEATEVEAVEVEPAQSEQTFMPTFGHHAQPADVVAEDEPAFDVDLEDAFNDESEAVAIAAAEPVAAVAAETPSLAAQDRSLEDELNALLGRMTARPAAAPSAEAEAWRPQFAAAPATVELPAQHEVEADLDASLVEEFAAADIEAVDEIPHAEDDIDFDTDAFDAAMAGGMDTLDEEPVEQVEEDPVEALKWAAPAAAAATATFAQPMRAWSRGNPVAPSSQPYSAPAQQYSASVQQFSTPAQLPPVQPAMQVEPRAEAAPQPVVQPAAASWQKPAQPVREDVPDIETMDVPERVVALADDLDIPEVPFEQDKPETSNFDELDAEFSTLLNEMLPGESAAPAKTAQYDDDANNYKRDRVEMPAYADTPQAAAAAAAYADLGYQGYDSRNPGHAMPAEGGQIADDGFDYDPDLEEGMTIPDAAAAEANEAPRRRGLLIAALVGAVAVVGGVGAFAFSFGGGSSSDAPAIVKADSQPMKVKPENPGGTVIPNQDNKVYDAVAKGARPATPTQPKLVANAEEPVDVVAKEQADRAERNAAFSGTDDSEGDAQGQNTAQQPVKSEDRVAQIAQENAVTPEGALVTPRKVRTMVVKPDGTLAPREEPAAAPVAASEPTDPTPQRVAPDQTGTVPQAGADQPALKPAKPSTVAATPSAAPLAPQRPSDQPVDIAGEIKPQAQQQQVASAQPQAPAPATAGWSMQIASQPTVEGAQSTYQDLARRYSNVLAGRSANIVKADVAGKGTFYRVRVMAQSREDAIKLCTSYKAAGGNCFVSK